GRQLLPLTGQLRQAVWPGAGVLAPVPTCPGGRVVEPVVGTAVDDERVVGQLRGDGGGLPVRQREDDDVVAGEAPGVARLDLEVGEPRQVGRGSTPAAARRRG